MKPTLPEKVTLQPGAMYKVHNGTSTFVGEFNGTYILFGKVFIEFVLQNKDRILFGSDDLISVKKICQNQ